MTVYQSTVMVSPYPSPSALSDAALNGGTPFIIQVQPETTPGYKRRQAESATYITAGGYTTTDPSKAVQYKITDGTLGATTGGSISTDASVEYMPFAINATLRSISTQFLFLNLHLDWNNTAVDGGGAGFYTAPAGNGSQLVLARFSGAVDSSWVAVTFAAQPAGGVGIETVSSGGSTTVSTMISMGSMTMSMSSSVGSMTSQSPSRTSQGVSPAGTCGADVGFSCYGAPAGNCCSQYGYCGSGFEYCGTGCQVGYGDCDVEETSTSYASVISTSGTVVFSSSVPVVPSSSRMASSSGMASPAAMSSPAASSLSLPATSTRSPSPSVSLSVATSDVSSVTYSITFTPVVPLGSSGSSRYIMLPTYSEPGSPIGPIGPVDSTSFRTTVFSLSPTTASSMTSSPPAEMSSSTAQIASSSLLLPTSSLPIFTFATSSSPLLSNTSYTNLETFPSIIPDSTTVSLSSVVFSVSTPSPPAYTSPSNSMAMSSTRTSTSAAASSTAT